MYCSAKSSSLNIQVKNNNKLTCVYLVTRLSFARSFNQLFAHLFANSLILNKLTLLQADSITSGLSCKRVSLQESQLARESACKRVSLQESQLALSATAISIFRSNRKKNEKPIVRVTIKYSKMAQRYNTCNNHK